MINDLRFAIRTFLKNRGVTMVAVFSLAVGIGANTAIFSLVDAILWRPAPVNRPDDMVELFTYDTQPPYGYPYGLTSYLDYTYYRDNNDVFTDLVAITGYWRVPLRFKGQSEFIRAEIVSGNYFPALGVDPFLGRGFLPEEDQTPGVHPVAVLSYNLWQRRFDSDPKIIDKQVIINGHSFTVVGVAPEGFKGLSLYWTPEIWLPAMMLAQVAPPERGLELLKGRDYWLRYFAIVGRLKPGIKLEQAQASLRVLARQLEQAYPETNNHLSVALFPERVARLGTFWYGSIARTLQMLAILVGCVLLIACTNVANLQVARATVRQKEMAIRQALGAGHGRLIRQLLTETVLLFIVGAAVGLLVAVGLIKTLTSFESPFATGPVIGLDLDPRLDSRVLGFTLLLSLVTGVISGLVPAVQASRPNLVPTLKQGGGGSGYRRSFLRNGLVIFQVALSMILLIGAGLFIRGLQQLWTIHLGFRTENVLLIQFDLYTLGFSDSRGLNFYHRLVEQLGTLPGVDAASLAIGPLPTGNSMPRIVLRGTQEKSPGEERETVTCNYVLPGYFQVVEIPIVQGRDFNSKDVEGSLPVIIVNETAARDFWPGQSPLGKRLKTEEDQRAYEVVGVTRDAKYGEVWENPRPFLFFAFAQQYGSSVSVHLKTSVDPLRLVSAVRGEVQRLDENVPIREVKTLQEHVRNRLSQPRMIATLSGILALVALILATVGIYGVVAYSVAQRTRELGVRVALGALPSDLLKLVLGYGMKLTTVGIAIGVVSSLMLRRFFASYLHGIGPSDPLTYGTISLILTGVSLLASYIPARRATKVDPMVALRYE